MATRFTGHDVEAIRSIAAQSGCEVRTVAALVSVNRLGILFDDRGILRRQGRDPKIAMRYLADVRRRWVVP